MLALLMALFGTSMLVKHHFDHLLLKCPLHCGGEVVIRRANVKMDIHL